MTYRYRGHSVADAGLAYRTKEEIVEQQAHDPIARVRATLRERGHERRGARRDRKRASTSASPPRSRSPMRARSPTSPSSPAACTRPGSGEQFARMMPGSPFGEEELVFDGGLGA